jgi:uncharacterized DUF497 family protein
MVWTWDEEKSAANECKHGLTFESAQLVFDDSLAVTRLDPYPDEARWQTIGAFEDVAVMVVHTWPSEEAEIPGRIISARKASSHERKGYTDGSFS